MALTDQVQIRLAGLEEHLDLPAFSINPNDLFFGKIRISADKCDPVLLVPIITNADDLSWYFLILTDHNIYGKQIFAATSALFADTEDLVD